MTLRTLNYGNYGIILVMGNAGFLSTIVLMLVKAAKWIEARVGVLPVFPFLGGGRWGYTRGFRVNGRLRVFSEYWGLSFEMRVWGYHEFLHPQEGSLVKLGSLLGFYL